MALERAGIDAASDGRSADLLQPWERDPYRLWSLWDMLEKYARQFLQLGMELQDFSVVLYSLEERTGGGVLGPPSKSVSDLTAPEREDLRRLIAETAKLCKELGLPTSYRLLMARLNKLPETQREFDLLIEAVKAELDSREFLFIPPHRAVYHDLVLPSIVTTAFPAASQEIVSACNCFAAGLFTASVFHAMRAAEIGVRALGSELGVSFQFGIDLADWSNVLDQIHSKIGDMKQRPRGPEKDADLQFYSESAAQFRYFKDGWRVRVAHARVTYEEPQALTVLDHTLSFFQTLATRLKEPVS